MIVHFSAVPKPSEKLFSREYSGMDDRKFLYDVIFNKYMSMFGKERPNHAKGRGIAEEFRTMAELVPIAFRLRDDTMTSGLEWFRLYADLVRCLDAKTMENKFWGGPEL